MAELYADVSDKEDNHEDFFDTTSECTDQQESDDENKEEIFYDCYAIENANEEEEGNPELEQLKADNRASRLPSIKDSIVLDSYITNEGAVQDVYTKCRKCLAADCKECLKAE